MRFKVDENLPVEVADVLRAAGHDAATMFEEHLAGRPDAHVASVCQREQRALVTLDTDFADLRAYPPDQYPGLIVLRVRQQSKPHILAVIGHLIPMLSTEPLDARLWIVEEDRVRIRG